MGTETRNWSITMTRASSTDVKLNNPLMGTETSAFSSFFSSFNSFILLN